ncbi:hypothetical protein K491DRAFT_746917 [Lophiostoma macrostomum CBS 122681]|uniref:Uncharacterized protein n=1 Tax=Lophiostoma macrostomum CBS 122681 TaxID=1314788 RepID=A0A6A6T8J2_9PLEO|nr:hypothetical protein K491DRAFT_746917 [Lophiostoma macrostomum CBS 122681]
MTFKEMMMDLRRIMLCCSTDKKKHSLEISSLTDFRREVLEIPGLSKEELALLREKPTPDALPLSLTSHPPTRPASTRPSASVPPSNPHSSAASSANSLANSSNASPASSRTPSTTLLNSASTNLPTTLPTPPLQKHTDNNPPTSAHSRMKGFLERTRRLSEAVSTHSRHSTGGYSHAGYDHLPTGSLGEDGREGVSLLNLDFKDTGFGMGMELDSPVSGKSVHLDAAEGFEVQDVVGGATAAVPFDKPVATDIKLGADTASSARVGKDIQAGVEAKKRRDAIIAKAIEEAGEVQSDTSEDEVDDVVLGTAEYRPLVRA